MVFCSNPSDTSLHHLSYADSAPSYRDTFTCISIVSSTRLKWLQAGPKTSLGRQGRVLQMWIVAGKGSHNQFSSVGTALQWLDAASTFMFVIELTHLMGDRLGSLPDQTMVRYAKLTLNNNEQTSVPELQSQGHHKLMEFLESILLNCSELACLSTDTAFLSRCKTRAMHAHSPLPLITFLQL